MKNMKKTMLAGMVLAALVAVTGPAWAFAPEPYKVVKVKEGGWLGWKRITLEIEAGTAITPRQQVETMMQAATDQFPGTRWRCDERPVVGLVLLRPERSKPSCL